MNKVDEHIVSDAKEQFKLRNIPKKPETFRAFMTGLLYSWASDAEAHIDGGLPAEDILTINMESFERFGEIEKSNQTDFDISDIEIPEEFEEEEIDPRECDHDGGIIVKDGGNFQQCERCGKVLVNE